jgi:hypothetical protein
MEIERLFGNRLQSLTVLHEYRAVVRTNVFQNSSAQHHMGQRLDHLERPQSSCHASSVRLSPGCRYNMVHSLEIQ